MQKVHVQFYNDDRSSRSIEITMKTTVSDVCDMLVTLNYVKHDINWTIVEHLAKFNLGKWAISLDFYCFFGYVRMLLDFIQVMLDFYYFLGCVRILQDFM